MGRRPYNMLPRGRARGGIFSSLFFARVYDVISC